MTPFKKIVGEFRDADIGSGYLEEVLASIIEMNGLGDQAAAEIERRWGDALAEYRAEMEKEKTS